MGFGGFLGLGSMLGLSDSDTGGAGLNYKAQGANLLQPTNIGQTDTAANLASTGINQQQQFVNALMGQNGLSNQNSVFQQQQALANQLQGVANGTGPNAALMQLNQATGANTANQAALMAGQRGSSANAGLMARQAAMQGANTQQQAAGQAASMMAQQQLGGMQALQGQQAQMGGMANAQLGQYQNALMGYNQAAQSEQQNLLNSMAQYNNANVGMQSNMNSSNAGISQVAAQGQQGLTGGLLNSVGTVLGLANGGMVPAKCYADGGQVDPNSMSSMISGPQSSAGKFFMFGSAPTSNQAPVDPGFIQTTAGTNQGAQAIFKGSEAMGKGIAGFAKGLIGGGAGGAADAGAGAAIGDVAMLAVGAQGGQVVPGNAAVPGNSLKNDKVPAMLSPKEIILPRSITMADNAPEKAKQFVAAILKKNGMGK